jgi:hypothetical protein
MNIKRILLFSCVGFFASSTANASTADSPLFAAFKKFCVETQAKPDAVKTAALEASGKKVASATSNKRAPVSAGGNSWAFTFQGHHLTVTAGTLHTPAAGNMPPTDTVTCAITDSDGDNAGAGAIGQWAAVPANAEVNGIFGTYTYQDKNGTHAPVKAADKAVKDPEGLWNLTLSQIGKLTAVNLAHVTAAGQ